MARTDKVFIDRLAKEVAKAARAHVKPKIAAGIGSGFGSKVLANELQIRTGVGTTRKALQHLMLDHYWAIYVHDGRGAFGPPKDAQVYVWYKNPKEDPRLRNRPKRFAGVRKLTESEFRRDKAAGKLEIHRFVHKSVPGSPFFSNDTGGGMSGFLATKVSPLAQTRFQAHIKKQLKSILNVRGVVKI